jgi:deoxycytidine triphosphate deaminase
MILCNTEVHKALDQGRLIIRPEPLPRVPTVGELHCPYDTHSVDLRLSPHISVPKGGQFSFDTSSTGNIAELITQHSEQVTLSTQTPFKLEPRKFILAKTVERIELPLQSPD